MPDKPKVLADVALEHAAEGWDVAAVKVAGGTVAIGRVTGADPGPFGPFTDRLAWFETVFGPGSAAKTSWAPGAPANVLPAGSVFGMDAGVASIPASWCTAHGLAADYGAEAAYQDHVWDHLLVAYCEKLSDSILGHDATVARDALLAAIISSDWFMGRLGGETPAEFEARHIDPATGRYKSPFRDMATGQLLPGVVVPTGPGVPAVGGETAAQASAEDLAKVKADGLELGAPNDAPQAIHPGWPNFSQYQVHFLESTQAPPELLLNGIWRRGGLTGRVSWTVKSDAEGRNVTALAWWDAEEAIEFVARVVDLGATGWGFQLGGATSAGLVLLLTDRRSGSERVYHNAEGSALAPIFDLSSFPK
jgi:hypothetical protein